MTDTYNEICHNNRKLTNACELKNKTSYFAECLYNVDINISNKLILKSPIYEYLGLGNKGNR